MSGRTNIHATGVVLGETGLILRGPPGAGKSLLALDLIEEWGGLLVSDDRVEIEATPTGLVMHGPTTIAGLIELRGRGIVSRPFVAQAPLHLVVDLVETLERMVEEEALVTELSGVSIARCPVPRAGVIDSRHQLMLIREAVRALTPDHGSVEKTT